jgi:hypothetical protein
MSQISHRFYEVIGFILSALIRDRVAVDECDFCDSGGLASKIIYLV